MKKQIKELINTVELNKLAPQIKISESGEISSVINISNLFNERNLDFRILKFISFETIFPKDYDEKLENSIHFNIDFLDKIQIKLIYHSSFYKNIVKIGEPKFESNLKLKYSISTTSEEIEKKGIEEAQKIINREYDLFNIKMCSNKTNIFLNEKVSRFLSNRLYTSYEKILQCYDEMFTGDIEGKGIYKFSGYNKLLSECFSLDNIPSLYEEAKKHPGFREVENFTSASENDEYKEKDINKEYPEKDSSNFMSEYLIFLFLLKGKMLFNLESFISDVSKEYKENKDYKNRLVDFRIIYGNERIGIQVKRDFKKGRKEANISANFDFDEDDMKISYINLITFYGKGSEFDTKKYIRKNKEKNIKRYKDQMKYNKNGKYRLLNRIITVDVDIRFIDGSKEEQIEFFKSLLNSE